jgi:hypothetical protein
MTISEYVERLLDWRRVSGCLGSSDRKHLILKTRDTRVG